MSTPGMKHFIFIGVVLSATLAFGATSAKRPNILFLFADDWAWPHASCLGDPVVKTPTFDRLAREGVMFRNAHAAAPSCSPSRAAVLTGQWPWRLEEGANLWTFLPAKFDVYPNLLQQAGYFIGLTGKGYGPGSDTGRPHNAAGPKFESFDVFLSARPKDKPFCFWFGSLHPHRPYKRDIGVKHGLDPAKVVVPPYLPDNDIVRRDICDYYYETELFDQEAGACLAALEKTGELDNTIVVISGDNGWPFPQSKATCTLAGTRQPLAVCWGACVKGGRIVDDFVSLSDLAPTFLEAAGVPVPATMTARSFLNVLLSDKSGQVDPSRDHVLTGMERHTRPGRTDGQARGVGYPMRTIITENFHYIRNFKPDRWPAGDPPKGKIPDFTALAGDTYAAFPEVDYGTAKAWIVTHRDEPAVKPFFERAFGKRPARELYDLKKDPYELKNVADDPEYAVVLQKLDAQLMSELKASGDPRTSGGGDEFDRYPSTKPKAVKSKAEIELETHAAAVKPNVVIIFIDDMGYADIGPFGATKQKTPHLDRMAKEGIKFTNFYAAPVCTVSRAQLMTGCYGPRISEPWVYPPCSKYGMNPAEFTMAERLKEQGYVTTCIGKWHLGDQPEFLPRKQGFDHYFGIPYSNDQVRQSKQTGEKVVPLVRDDKVLELLNDEAQNRIVERYTEEAVGFLRKNRERPFFLYLAHTAVHVPIHPGAAFVGKSANGRFGDWVEELDWSVGRVLDTLRELKLSERTLVVFTSDNGPWLVHGKDAGSAFPLRGGKGSTWEGGLREPTLAWWPGKIAPGSVCDAVAGTIDLLPTCVALAGGVVPAQPVIDGRDISSLLFGTSRESPREAHYYFSRYNLQAVRQGPWKLAVAKQVETMGKEEIAADARKIPRLYNLDEDIGEQKDVAEKHPDIVAKLQALADKMSVEIGGDSPRCRRPAGEVANPQLLYPGVKPL